LEGNITTEIVKIKDYRGPTRVQIPRCPVCQWKLYYRATVMKKVCTNQSCEEYWTGENKPRPVD